MGGRPPVIEDEEFVEFIGEATNPAVVSTREVADHFDMSPQGAIKRLNELEEEGRISSKTVGNVKIWYISSEDQSSDTPD
jgi:CTP-dependent riboflavin kinase